MYTSCPECGTVFRISTNDLRVAEGHVRCGNCSATFNAIATLTDEPPPTVTLQQLVLPTEPEPGTAAAEQQAATAAPLPVSDDTLEFDIPEGSWSNFFEGDEPPAAPEAGPFTVTGGPAGAGTEAGTEVETESKTQSVDSASPPDVGHGVGSDTVDQAGLYRALWAETGVNLDGDADWQALLKEVGDDDPLPEPAYVIGEAEPQDPPGEMPLPDLAWDALAPGDTPAPLPADFVPELAPAGFSGGAAETVPASAARREPSVADRPFVWEPPAPPPDESGRHWGYTAGSVVAVLLLVMQLLHLQRDELATDPRLMEPLRRTYAALGLPLWPAWDLGSYQLRTSEAVADRSSPGALDILGRIAVVGGDRVGLPLVRVTLRDRFGKPLGTRVFQPAEYLGRDIQLREPLSPGTLIPVQISLKDPGRDAQGFDVDVCVMSRRDGITCTADREPFAR